MVHCPPGTNFSSFLQLFESLPAFIIVNQFQLLLCGVSNINMLKDSIEYREFCTALKSSGIVNTVTDCYWVPSRSLTLLDMFIGNVELENDNFPIFSFTKNKQSLHCCKEEPISIHVGTDIALGQFRKKRWWNVTSSVFSVRKMLIRIAYDKFISLIKKMYETCFPYKKVKRKRMYKDALDIRFITQEDKKRKTNF